MQTTDTSGQLEEALERVHATGPERLGRLTNHAPMVVEALAAHGQAGAVHRWLDLYHDKLEDFPDRLEPVTDANWPTALGDPRRAADWIDHFTRTLAERPWRDVLAEWWPRLLPGMYGGSTHPVIRTGHAVRALESGENAPRRTELAHALGYWAARHHPVSGITTLPGAPTAAASLDAVPAIAEGPMGFPARLAAVRRLPLWAGEVSDPDTARERLTELVQAATHRYATHGHGEETMLVHAATAPNAVLRTLGSLPRDLWAPSLHAAWTASAAVTAMYAPAEPVTYTPPARLTAEEVVERALAHGDEHVIKLTDTALDVGDEQALAAAQRAIEISAPLV
ncbi:questin oxidase family protein [Streptomyces cylindrosporus]|uniref:Questin oxidase family protein n=1 Tax=Streptomyces cylindrosporus TaxID=2927583 RepID=A0ABS9Y960_9ACTN|nr:questin oxidase family protein [Streptomyces cylindrosporus]MCI3273757.1 questin oxidase family protein [Streptomyces cylindrosporus]